MVSEEFDVKLLCYVLEISRSGFYSWMDRSISQREIKNEILTKEIKKIHDDSRKTYGLPRIKAKLEEMGEKASKNRVAVLMKKANISGLIKRRFKIKTTDSKHDLPIAERVFKTEEPSTHPVKKNQIWASDISYISTGEGFLFLATYLDLFTRKIVGFVMADRMRTDLLFQALEMAIGRQGLKTSNLLSHSDRGSQYASGDYRERLKALGITASM